MSKIIQYNKQEEGPDKRYILYVYYPHEGMYIDSYHDAIDGVTKHLKKNSMLANRYEMYDRVDGITYDIKIDNHE
jgi:hypothetical protein